MVLVSRTPRCIFLFSFGCPMPFIPSALCCCTCRLCATTLLLCWVAKRSWRPREIAVRFVFAADAVIPVKHRLPLAVLVLCAISGHTAALALDRNGEPFWT